MADLGETFDGSVYLEIGGDRASALGDPIRAPMDGRAIFANMASRFDGAPPSRTRATARQTRLEHRPWRSFRRQQDRQGPALGARRTAPASAMGLLGARNAPRRGEADQAAQEPAHGAWRVARQAFGLGDI